MKRLPSINPGRPMASTYETMPNAYVAQYGGIALTGDYGCVMKTGLVAGACATFSMDINPANGLSLSYDIPALEPTVQLNANGVQVSVGQGSAAAKVDVGPMGITLTYMEMMKVKLHKSGITLEAGPKTAIELKPTGITLKGLSINHTP